MEIVNADTADLDNIFELYDKAIEFQKSVFEKSWIGFDRNTVENEITEKRLWKIIEATQIACIYSVAYADPLIWGGTSHEAAIYIHRIVTNPDFRGRGFVRVITSWAKNHARTNRLRFVRMDTWGDNLKLIDYYQECGFKFRGLVEPAESETLPKHYRGISLSLFEIDLEDDQASV